ncbi:MAG: hypothetical protein O0V67_09045 [Methanocorpusculum sp.]|nr:hypothetical protein [Methanocorpusculum sp.]
MSHNETLKLIAFFAVVILIGCFISICLIQYGNSINTQDKNTTQSVPTTSVQRTPGLLVVSHGEEIIPEKGTAVVTKMKQIAEENFQYWLAIRTVNVADCRKQGVVITAQYNPPTEITWVDYYGSMIIGSETNVTVEKLMVTIPDNPNWETTLSYFIVVYSPRWSEKYLSNVYVLQMTVKQANELLELIGLDPIPESP